MKKRDGSLEGPFQKSVVQDFRAAGAVVLNKKGSVAEGKGWPDVFVWHRIWSGMLELKSHTGKNRKAQLDRIGMLREQGADALCCRPSKNRSAAGNMIEVYWIPGSPVEHTLMLPDHVHQYGNADGDARIGLLRLRFLRETACSDLART